MGKRHAWSRCPGVMGVGPGGDGDPGNHTKTGQYPPHTHTHLGAESAKTLLALTCASAGARADPTAAGSALQPSAMGALSCPSPHPLHSTERPSCPPIPLPFTELSSFCSPTLPREPIAPVQLSCPHHASVAAWVSSCPSLYPSLHSGILPALLPAPHRTGSPSPSPLHSTGTPSCLLPCPPEPREHGRVTGDGRQGLQGQTAMQRAHSEVSWVELDWLSEIAA